MAIVIRNYQPSDAQALAALFYNTIHHINAADYSPAQLDAWAPPQTKHAKYWLERWQQKPPFIATHSNIIAGFAEFESNGHIDCFYVHHEYQQLGVGSALMHHIEQHAAQANISKIFAEVSITAKPFFLAKGFTIIKEQSVIRRGVSFINFVMEKRLSS